MAMQYAYGSTTFEARVLASVDDAIGIWRISGQVVAEMLPAIMNDAGSWHQHARALSHVADYRTAHMLAPLEVFVSIASKFIRPGAAIGAPMVIVPMPEQASYFQSYAARMTSMGVGRVVCLDYVKAHRWAVETAAYRLRAGFAQREPGSSASTVLRDTSEARAPKERPAASLRVVLH